MRFSPVVNETMVRSGLAATDLIMSALIRSCHYHILVWPFWPFHPIYWDGNEMEKMVLKMVWNSLKMVCKNDVRMV